MNLRDWPARLAVWSLAAMSFACLLGHLYGFWSMRIFACLVLAPATLALGWWAWKSGERGQGPRQWIIEGALGGVVAAVVYDLFRLPFVLAGKPLFAVFPRFGQMLLGASSHDFGLLVHLTGWAYHFSNGAALGIMFLAMAGWAGRRRLIWAAVAWAVVVECLLLLSPYYSFFKLKMDVREFVVLTLTAHMVFGYVLGLWCSRRVSPVTGLPA